MQQSRTDQHVGTGEVDTGLGDPSLHGEAQGADRSATAEISGVELLYTMYCDAIGWPLPANREQMYQGVKWIYLRHDFQSAFYRWRRGELTLKE